MATKKKTAKKKTTAAKPKAKKAPAKKAKPTKAPRASTARVIEKLRTQAKGAAHLTLKAAPVLWRLSTSTQAVGIHVEPGQRAWVANDNGEIFATDLDGNVQQSFKLDDAVRCLLADEVWKYAGCDDGKVYDLTGRAPRVAYEIGDEALGIDWLEVYRGTLCVSDNEGGLTVIDAEGSVKWKKRNKKHGQGWMVRADGAGVYHGGDAGVHAYDWDGNSRWSFAGAPHIGFGSQEGDALFALSGRGLLSTSSLVAVGKDGAKRFAKKCATKAPGFSPNGAESCAAAPDRAFGGVGEYVFCFDRTGRLLWEAPTGCGAACSMQFADDKLYIVTHHGALACIDVSEAAIASAARGSVPKVVVRKVARLAKSTSRAVERTKDASGGVIVECFKEGGKLRVRVVSDGYEQGWFVQFPRDIREDGARYVVDEVRVASQGGFYRALGDIKRLDS